MCAVPAHWRGSIAHHRLLPPLPLKLLRHPLAAPSANRENDGTAESPDGCRRAAPKSAWGGSVTYHLAVPLSADSDDVVVFQADRQEVPDSLVLASDDADKMADRARVTLEDALSKLKPSLRKVIDLLKDLSPDETSVDFGLSVGGEYGMVIAKGTAQVNFAIHMTWKSA
jgi:Trypsin-co-occurring domain 1